MAAPTPADMSVCDPKVRCKTGEYAGQAYNPSDPCAGQTGPAGNTFEWQGCEEGCVDTDNSCVTNECGAYVYYRFAPWTPWNFKNACGSNCGTLLQCDRDDLTWRSCPVLPEKTGTAYVPEGWCLVETNNTYPDPCGGKFNARKPAGAVGSRNLLRRTIDGTNGRTIDAIYAYENGGTFRTCYPLMTEGYLTWTIVPREQVATRMSVAVDQYVGGIPGCDISNSQPGACSPPNTFDSRIVFNDVQFGGKKFKTSSLQYLTGWAAKESCDINPSGYKTVFQTFGGGYDYLWSNYGKQGTGRTIFDANSPRMSGGVPDAIGLLVTLEEDWSPGFFDRNGENPSYEPDTVIPAGSKVVYGISSGGGNSASGCNWEGQQYRNPEISFSGAECINGPAPQG